MDLAVNSLTRLPEPAAALNLLPLPSSLFASFFRLKRTLGAASAISPLIIPHSSTHLFALPSPLSVPVPVPVPEPHKPMNTQALHPATVNTSTTQYGQTASIHDSQAMDIDTDGQTKPGQNKEEDLMDTSLDPTHDAQSKGKETDRGEAPEVTAILQSESETKSDVDRPGTDAEAPYLLCKTGKTLCWVYSSRASSLYGR